METLFDDNFVNKKPLRKYEPLIRFDVDGKPQPRRLIDTSIADDSHGKKDKSQDVTVKKETTESISSSFNSKTSDTPRTSNKPLIASSESNTNPKADEPADDLKRKIPHPPAKGIEPMKKKSAPKQTSIMNFFGKKTSA